MKRIDNSLFHVMRQSYDYIVIGGGMYGGYFATKVAEKSGYSSRILLIEKGDFKIWTHHDNMPKQMDVYTSLFNSIPYRATLNGKVKDKVSPDIQRLGGKSLAWGKWSPRLSDEALKAWPEAIQAKMGQWYDEVENDLNIECTKALFQNSAFDTVKGLFAGKIETLGEPMPPPIAILSKSIHDDHNPQGAYSVVPGLLDAKQKSGLASGCIDILLNSSVRRLNKDESGSVATIVLAGAKPSIKVGQAQVILASGLADSTRLGATASDNPLIGQNLKTHFRSNVMVKAKASDTDFTDMNLKVGMHIPGRYNGRDYHFQFGLTKKNRDRDLMADAVEFTLFIVGEKGSNSSTLDPATARVNWNITAEDDQFMQFITGKGRELAFILFGGIKLLWQNNKGDWVDHIHEISDHYEPVSSSYHESSSMIMGNDLETSVVNPLCRFHDIENLYCIGQSVFPANGSSNPVPTGMAMALNVIDSTLRRKKIDSIRVQARQLSGSTETVPLRSRGSEFTLTSKSIEDATVHMSGASIKLTSGIKYFFS
jgi:hypothetical protein